MFLKRKKEKLIKKEKQYKLNSRQKKWPNLKCMNKTPGNLEMITNISQKGNSREFSGGPVAKTPHSQRSGPGFNPWSRN